MSMDLERAQSATLGYMKHHRQFPIGVKDWRSVDGLWHITEACPDGAKMAEIGSYWGESTMFFWKSRRFSKIIAVDPGKPEVGGPANNDNIKNNIVDKSDHLVSLIELTGHEAAPMVPPGYLDMVYIDAVHDYENLTQDIKDWLPKIKAGGIISGHDYDPEKFPGVCQAVVEQLGFPEVFTDTSWMIRL